MKKLFLLLSIVGFLTASTIKSKYIKEGYIYAPTSCSYKCEDVKDGYFARVANLNLEKGLITCNIYSEMEPLRVLEKRTLINPHCKDKYTFIPNKNHEEPDTLRLDSQLKVLETKYFKNYGNTGLVKFLTAPEYLVAILTADAGKINIKETVESNRIVLNQGYTIYPNENTNYEADYLTKVVDFFSEINLFGEEENTIIPIEKYPTELKSSTSKLISTIGVLWLEFLLEANSLYQFVNIMIVTIISPFALLILAGESITQKYSNVQNGNNWIGGIVLSIIVALTMFFSYSTVKSENIDIFQNPKQLDQSFYQDISGGIFSEGVQVANSFNATFNKVYINQMARNANVNPSLTQEERMYKLEYLQKIHEEYNTYLEQCSLIYNTSFLKHSASGIYNMPMNYPPDETFGSTSFYMYLNNSDQLITHNLYSVNSCYEVERNKKLYAIKITDLAQEIELSKKAYDDNMEKRVLNIAEIAYKNTIDMGFLSALTTASMNATLSNLEEYQHYSDNIEDKKAYIEKETYEALKTYSDISASDFLENNTVSMLPKSLPYFMMPFFKEIHNAVAQMALLSSESLVSLSENKIYKKQTYRGNVGNQLGMKTNGVENSGFLDLIANFLVKIAKRHPSFSFLESLLSIGNQAIILAVSIWIYEYILSLLVPFAIFSAGLLVILFWIAEIVIYYLVIPFMMAHAMIKGQGATIGKFLVRGLIIASRPTLIVFSIIVAILLYSLYEAISIFIITKNFSAIFGLNELGMLNTFTGLMQQGFFEIAIKLIIPFIMFFIILVGSTMFLKQFGYSDEAEFGQQLQQLESKSGKYMPV